MREVSETGDDYIFSSRAYTSIVKGLTRSNNKAEQAKYDLCICVDWYQQTKIIKTIM